MTRINAGIPPKELSDKHLLAEHREIKRIPNMIAAKGCNCLDEIPEHFVLGKGHVKFFYNKIAFLHMRYLEIYSECLSRLFKVENYQQGFLTVLQKYPQLYNDYEPTLMGIGLIKERILQKSKCKTWEEYQSKKSG